MTAEISPLGAKIISLKLPNSQTAEGPNGAARDLVLGFRTPDEWRTQEPYFNAICGRVANRIRRPDGSVMLHGGKEGFNAKIWEVIDHSNSRVTLHYRSPDGEEGFPGNLDVYVTYSFHEAVLRLDYKATTDAPTIVALTNHAYFNLNGESSGPIDNHRLQIFADYYTPLDQDLCPTGEIAPVEGTDLDFRQPRLIGPQPLDFNWCLQLPNSAAQTAQLKHAGTLQTSDLAMECWTTMHGLQVYTGEFIEQHIGKSGTRYDKRHAVCLEAQQWPDAPNHPNFPSIALLPGQTLNETTEYRFYPI